MDNPAPFVCGVCGGTKFYNGSWAASLALQFGAVKEIRYGRPPSVTYGWAVDHDADCAPADVRENRFEALLCEHCRDALWDWVESRMP